MALSITSLIGPIFTVALRISGLMLFAPFFGSTSIAPRIKVVLTVVFTIALCPPLLHRLTPLPVDGGLFILGCNELIVGIALGITTMLVFEAAQFAGQILSIQMGYSLINILDPNTEVETTVISMFHQMIAILIFLRLDVHHWLLRAIGKSFEYLPPGSFHLGASFVSQLTYLCGSLFGLGLQIAAPVLSATLFADVAIGLLGKAAPQVQLMLLGPALKSILGLSILGAALVYWPGLFARLFELSMSHYERLLEVVH